MKKKYFQYITYYKQKMVLNWKLTKSVSGWKICANGKEYTSKIPASHLSWLNKYNVYLSGHNMSTTTGMAVFHASIYETNTYERSQWKNHANEHIEKVVKLNWQSRTPNITPQKGKSLIIVSSIVAKYQ